MGSLLQYLENWTVPIFLLSSMLAIGLKLTPAAILAPLRDARLVILVMILNFVVAPAFAWLLTVIIPLDRGHAIGLILLGGAAGAPFFPKLAEVARVDLALSAAVLGLLTAGTIIFMPFALPLMVPEFKADAWSIARPLVMLIALPFVIGITMRARVPKFAERVEPVTGGIGTVSLLALSVLLFVRNLPEIIGVVGSGAILAALLFISGLFVVGWWLGGIRRQGRGVIGLGTAARNFGAALVPASNSFKGNPRVTTMVIVSGIICLVVTALSAGWVKRRTAYAPESDRQD